MAVGGCLHRTKTERPRWSRPVGLGLTGLALVLSSGCGDPAQPGPNAAATTSTTTPVASSTGVASDEPCTRHVAPGQPPSAVGLRGEDLERMVLTQDELGPAAADFEGDPVTHGFHDNAELPMIEVGDPTHACDDLAESGRITGYGTGLTAPPEERRRIVVSVHLFVDEAGATGWVDVLLERFRAQVGDGVESFEATPSDELGAGGFLLRHVGPEGIRDWALIRRGPLVGSVVDVHKAPAPTLDVASAAKALGAKIDTVVAGVGQRPPVDDLDVSAMKSALVPRAELGDRYAELEWDSFFGGCADAFEREAVAGEDELEDVRRYGRVTGCTAMYSPSESALQRGDPGPVVRVFTAIHAFADATGASGYLQDTATELEGGRAIDVATIGDETAAVVAPETDSGPRHTRVLFRVGKYVALAALQERGDDDRRAEVERIATRLHERVAHLRDGQAP